MQGKNGHLELKKKLLIHLTATTTTATARKKAGLLNLWFFICDSLIRYAFSCVIIIISF